MKDKCKDCYFSDNGDCTCSGVKMCVSNRDERRQAMSDVRLIDANKLKEKLQTRRDNGGEDFDKGYNIGLDTAVELIDSAPTIEAYTKDDMTKEYLKGYNDCKDIIQPTGKWIPISERLPDKMGTYLVTLEYKEHGQGITTLWYHGEDIGWDLRVADVVVAWMPLPEPYKKGEEE